MNDRITVSIIGASGYSGMELLKILSRHPHAKVERLFANSSAGERVDGLYPWLRGKVDGVYETYTPEAVCTSDIVFIALPSGHAMKMLPELLARGKRVIDLGGDFRLADTGDYLRYYGREHTAPELLRDAVYGMPEWDRRSVRSARLIANPGCYPTSAILPLAPLLREGMIEPKGIVINSMSGASGAGRSAAIELGFSEVNENARAYKVGSHQHIPEIRQALEIAAGKEVSIIFTPHLIPITRGILTTTCAKLTRESTGREIEEAFERAYGDEPFVRFASGMVPEIKNVVATNYIDIGFRIEAQEGRIVLLSAIDNLVKGAAGQAVQNMNILFGIEEAEGLQ